MSSATFANAAGRHHRRLRADAAMRASLPGSSNLAGKFGRDALFAPLAPASAVFSDTFTYSDGNLVGNGGWIQNGATSTNPIQVTSGHAVVGPTGQDVQNNFSSAVTHTDGTSIFAGFDLTVTAGSAAGDYFLHYIAGGGNDLRLFATTSGGGFVLGLMSSTGDLQTNGSTVLSLNTTYRVVLSWNFLAGAKNDTMSIYINPTDLTVEGNNTAYLNYTWGAGGATEPTSIASIDLRQGTSGPAENIDNLNIGTIFADVSTIPEPSTWMMIGVGAVLLAGVQRFRRKS